LIVEKAEAASHSVTAFVRDASRYAAPNGVRVMSGDTTYPKAVLKATNGQNAVLDAMVSLRFTISKALPSRTHMPIVMR
jgi:putative NADH-flavin reductase